jgi:O-antigen/teichoic acid export membrane protein
VVAAFVLPGLLDVSPDQQDVMRVVMILVATSFCLSIPSDSFGSVLAGLGRYDLLFASLSVGLLAQAGGWVGVLLLGGGLVGLAGVSLVTGIGGQLSRWWLANRVVGGLRPSRRNFRRDLLRPLASSSFWFSLRDVAVTVIERIDTVVVGFVVGVPAAAVYSIGQRAVTFIGKLVRPLSTSLLPHSAALAERGASAEAVVETVVTGARFSLYVAAPLCLTVGLFAGPLIDLWVGDGFAEAATVVVLLGAAEATGALVEPVANIVRGRGLLKAPALISLGEAALNIALSIALGRAYGLEGVAIGTLVARVAVQLGVFLPYALRQLRVPASRLAGEALASQLPALAAGAAAGVAVRALGDGVALTLAGCAATVLVFAAVLAVTAFSPDERRRVVGLLRRSAGADQGAADRATAREPAGDGVRGRSPRAGSAGADEGAGGAAEAPEGSAQDRS